MRSDDRLSDQELWQSDGHLSELALTALADGERALLSAAAEEHAHACDACTARLGQLALLSVSVSEALLESPLPVRASEPFPAWAVVVGLVLAGVGAVPALWDLPLWLTELPGALVQSTPIALRVLGSLIKAASNAGPSLLVVWLAATLVLGSLGFLVARQVPRRTEWKGARA